jgi:acetyl-CoA carboxylase carboxyl transferase subunit beta
MRPGCRAFMAEIRAALDTLKGVNCMSWLEKLLPPKIQQTDPTERRTVPEGLWIKCPSCETVLYKTDLEQNVNVCPKCGHHHRIGARARLDAFLDPEGRYEIGQEVCRSTR